MTDTACGLLLYGLAEFDIAANNRIFAAVHRLINKTGRSTAVFIFIFTSEPYCVLLVVRYASWKATKSNC